MSGERADHLWSQLSRPENRGMSIIAPCCALPQSAHDGVAWAELIAREAWKDDDIPRLDAATHLAQQRERADAAERELAELTRFLDEDVMTRYVELFEAAGLGDPSESVVVQEAKRLLARRAGDGAGGE